MKKCYFKAILFLIAIVSKSQTFFPLVGTGLSEQEITVTSTPDIPIIKKGEICLSNCITISDSVYFDPNLPIILRTDGTSQVIAAPILKITKISNIKFLFTVKLPPQGSYKLLLKKEVDNNNYNYRVFKVFTKIKSFEVKPDTCTQNRPFKVTITGINTKVCNNCSSNSSTSNVDSKFYYSTYFPSGTSTLNGELNVLDYTQINDNSASVTLSPITVTGNFYLSNKSSFSAQGDFFAGGTTDGMFSVNTISVKPLYVSFSPQNGVSNSFLKLKLSGKNIKIGKGTNCNGINGCEDIGDTLLLYYYGYTSNIPKKVAIENYSQIDDYNAECYVKLPIAGTYSVHTKNNFLLSNIMVVEPSAFDLNKTRVKANNFETYTLKGLNTLIGNNNYCSPYSACANLGDTLYFVNIYTQSTYKVSIKNQKRIDSSTISFVMRNPPEGTYKIKTAAMELSNIYLYSTNPSFMFSPNYWEENTLMNLTVQSKLTKISNEFACLTDSNCTQFGDSLFFYESKNSSYVFKQKIISYKKLSDTTANISFITPPKGIGYYYLGNGKNFFSESNLILDTIKKPTAMLYNQKMQECYNSKSYLNVYFAGLPPYKLTYNKNGQVVVVDSIKENVFTIANTNLTNTIIELKEVSNLRGKGLASGITELILNGDTLPTAILSRVDSATNKYYLKFKIDFQGKGPWNVVLNNGIKDSSMTFNSNPAFFSIKPNKFTTYSLSYLTSSSSTLCMYGTVSGKVEYKSGDIVTDIDEESNKSAINIYPNPTNGILNLESILNYEIFNAQGEIIMKQNLNSDKLDISEYPKGLYFINAYGLDGLLKKFKIVKE